MAAGKKDPASEVDPRLISFNPATFGIREYMLQLARTNFILGVLPEIDLKQIGMVSKKFLSVRKRQLPLILTHSM